MSKKSSKSTKSAAPAVKIPLARDGARLAQLRDEGVTWDAIGLMVARERDPKADSPASAIPLRVVLRRYLAEQNALAPLAPTGDAVVKARDAEGQGFPLIAARTGLTVGAVKKLYAEHGGESQNGRIYVGAAGRTLVTPDGSTSLAEYAEDAAATRLAERAAAKAAKKAKKARKAKKAA